jgi:predicted ribosomally synthesized peptide with SipW-like signal peptide
MSRTKTKRYLVLLAAVGLVAAALGGSGTFASFNAETTNAGNTFATGTLLLDNTHGVTTCHSATDTTGNSQTTGCSILFTVPSLTDTSGATYADLTLSNVGTVDAGDITLFSSNPCITASNGLGVTFGGGADLCGNLQMVVIETDASFHHDSAVGHHALGCAYGTVDVNNATDGLGCTFAASPNLGALPTSGSPATLSLASAVSGNTGTDLTHAQSRYFLVGIKPPTPLTNAYQNRKGQFDLTWHIDQS